MGNLASSASQTIKFSNPTLYESCAWPTDVDLVRDVLLDSCNPSCSNKLAPLFPPVEEPGDDVVDEMEECPVCMLFYRSLNRANCCRKGICSECFLQWQLPQHTKDCPFCLASAFTVSFEGPLSAEEREREKDEQRKVSELEAKMRNDEIERDSARNLAKQKKLRREADAFRRVSGHGDPMDHEASEEKEMEQQQQQEGKQEEQEVRPQTQDVHYQEDEQGFQQEHPATLEEEEEQLRAAIAMSLRAAVDQ